jgi:hypothetical protein
MEEEGGEENDESTDGCARRRVAKSSLPDLSIATSPRREEDNACRYFFTGVGSQVIIPVSLYL